jgi:hypothetical protein
MTRHQWVDNDRVESDDDHPTSYLDVVCRSTKLISASSPLRAQTRPVVVQGRGGADTRW